MYSIRLPKVKTKTRACYALYLGHGYIDKTADEASKIKLNEYVSENFKSWIQHGKSEGTWPWVLVCTTVKAKSWSLASAPHPSLSTKPAIAELKQADKVSNMYHWSTGNRAVIQTRSGPSSNNIKSLEGYTEFLDPNSEVYQDTEECHCVALEAIGILPQDQNIRNRTRTLYQASQATIRSAFSFRTTPNSFRPTDRLEALRE